MAKKNVRQEIILDMDQFLITYAATILNPNDNLSQIVSDAAKGDINKLDDLFKDNGFGRINKFYNVGVGSLRNNNLGISEEDLKQKADQLAKDAINYLGSNSAFFEKWRTD
ncbi:hypothetical protein PL11_005325 [Lentilactobacillus curieae]|uniref:Uncharacterized protein n=1 Tax=Lentilactobacillus curieae TaxID=1138822 RepID=A0A1S6QIF3_9LACO|nr:hypothetical protein [Lentilactobacillus curieae]AQW21392.1 hypothetical protein PL11_005325 [Lentilactobacillus curieae]